MYCHCFCMNNFENEKSLLGYYPSKLLLSVRICYKQYLFMYFFEFVSFLINNRENIIDLSSRFLYVFSENDKDLGNLKGI